MKKKINIIFIVLFIIIIILVPITMAFTEDKEFSENENRYLSSKPKISINVAFFKLFFISSNISFWLYSLAFLGNFSSYIKLAVGTIIICIFLSLLFL